MTEKQLAHVEEQLITMIDQIVKKQKATLVELDTLPKIALALVEIHKISN